MASTNTSSVVRVQGPSVLSLLGVAFIILKLVGVISWPWVWVLAPFWIGLAIGATAFVIFISFAVLVFTVGLITERKKKW